MVLFLADALEKQLRKLIKIFITRDALNEAKTKWLLVNLNMTKKENLLSQDKPKIGTALKTMLGELDVQNQRKHF